MSIIERDIERCFLELSPAWVFVIIVSLGIIAIWLIELVWGHFVVRLPYGLASFRYLTNFVGDVGLVGIIAIWVEFNKRVQVEDDSFWTNRTFSLEAVILGFLLAVLFVTIEETTREWPKELSFFHNPNRLYHFLYFAWLAGLLIGASRIIKYGIVDGHEQGLAFAALALFVVYIATFVLDTFDLNPAWRHLRAKYPVGAAHVEG